ncbi:MAG: hydrogenase iron-sulfur subunit [Desulfobacteraceae bacterium]|nr:hydrogenase iron-sulfur subunit [Desulfobacteraceae bacterium]
MIDINVSKEVLVIGSGPAGLAASEKITALGYEVITIPFASGDSTDSINLERVLGSTGAFKADLVKNGERKTQTFGAIVAAPEYKKVALNNEYGLKLSDNVITQTQFDELLETESGVKGLINGNGSSIAFVSGYGQESNPSNSEKILKAAQKVQSLEKCDASIFAKNVKVGAHGLEKLFTKARHDGVLCFKPESMPEIKQSSNKLTITAFEPVVRKEMEFSPDYIVIEESLKPDEKTDTLKSILRIDTDFEGFYQSNNVHRFPVMTNRAGIYVAHQNDDAANIALRIKELLGDGIIQAPKDQGIIDPEKCVLCLTCYRCCPHGAISWDNEVAIISPVACQGCGICASECPMDAIQIKDFSDDSLREDVDKAVDSTKSIVVFCCENSALPAYNAAKSLGNDLPDHIKVIHIPCGGKVDVEFVWQSLVQGAVGVVIAACHEGNCKSEKGNTYAKWRFGEIAKRLEAIGISQEKVGFINIASNMADDFIKKVNEFAKKL